MGIVIALDYGTKRVGVAVTDELQIIASPLQTVENKDLLSFLSKFIKENNVEKLIIGKPFNLQGGVNELETHILKFIILFQKAHSTIIVERIDERFTSKMAQAAILDSGLTKKKRRDKSILDRVSAAIILQSFLDSK